MDQSDSERRFGERDWASQQDFESFMRQNDPNHRRNSNTRAGPRSRASETFVPRMEPMGSPHADGSSIQRRNTFDPSTNSLRVPFSMAQTPSRWSPRGRPKAPPLGDDDDDDDDDMEDLRLSEDDDESSDQKPAAVRMQQVDEGIEAPVIGSPYASMVSQDRWHSGGAPSSAPDANRALPTPTVIPPPRPNYKPLEPSVPQSKLGRRCLIHKPKREADLVKGLAVVGADGSIRSRDTIVVKCANCHAILSMPRSAIVVSCPSCYKISPAASCQAVNVMGNQ